MSPAAVYRFLPWSRRGLVAELRDSGAAAFGALPVRGAVKLDLTLAGGLGTATTEATIAGPGDVVGLDPSAIVRTTPRPNTSNAEPNYLVSVDFDAADLPWLMTPSAANGAGQLRPWLVLVVVERRRGVEIGVPAGAPLPQLSIESGAQQELPNLAGSWAWAHSQLLVEQGTGVNAADLSSAPDRNVSRLLCPRRLRPGTRWIACLVPAFDAGVRRGLGQAPAGSTLAPAWTDQASVTLPVYFHWEFGTGPEGDFESLARRLKPYRVTSEGGVPNVGTVKMHIGAAGGPVDLPDNHPQRIGQMDGALRALQQDDGKLSEIPTELRNPLGQILDAIADPRGTDPDDGAVGPPLYGAWHANRFTVAGADRGWFAELNLDPRARVAAGLGAEVVRERQEDLVAACWEQVGAVLKANALLSRARLSIAASLRFHDRTVRLLPPHALLPYAGPLTARTPFRNVTVRAAIASTSLPDSTVDPAMRRFTAPTNRLVAKSARRTQVDASLVRAKLVTTLSAGSAAVDPTVFVPAGVAPPAGRNPVVIAGGLVDLTPIGLPVVRPAAEVDALQRGLQTVRAKPVPAPATRLLLRPNLRQTGMVTSKHVAVLRDFAGRSDAAGGRTVVISGISDLQTAAVAQPGAAGFLLGATGGGAAGPIRFDAVDVTARNEIVRRTGPTERNEILGRIEGPVHADVARNLITRLPAGTLR
ncbi:MAG: hypothetical protein LC733_09175, partial [Actinobacteria bacterium]|nr:hypothetical protein [Actinomycetota bacterium]